MSRATLWASLLAAAGLFLASPGRALWWWGPTSESRWLHGAITIDGLGEDWRSQEPDDAEGLSFAFANDDRNLYVLVSPHTKSAKAQLSGANGQDFTIWLDPKGGTEHRLGITLRAAASAKMGRALEVRVGTATVSAPEADEAAELRLGPLAGRGVLEARIALRYLGMQPPGKLSVGLEASRARNAPGGFWAGAGSAKRGDDDSPKGGGEAGRARPPIAFAESGEDILPIRFWIRVILAAKP